MANQAATPEKTKGRFERFSGAIEKIHYAIGAVALAAGAEVFAVYEFAHGLVWNWLKKRSEKRRQQQTARAMGQLAAAH